MPHWIADMWAYGLLGVLLLVAAVTDARSGKIGNWLTYPAVAVALIGHTLAGGLTGGDAGRIGLVGSLGGMAVGFLPLLAGWLAGGVGGGDAKLMAAVGALAGWRFALAALFYGFAVAAVMALVVMVRRRILRRTLLRIGRFLLLLLGPLRPGDPATRESPKIPLGVALCIGSGLALLEVIFRGPLARKILLGL